MAKKPTKKSPAKKSAKPAKPAPAAKAARKIFNNEDQEAKALFLAHLSVIKKLQEKQATANLQLKDAYASAKEQGEFEKADFKYAIDLETEELEAKARAKIVRNLKIARYMGSDLGAQLDMFLEPDRTPASDRAYHEGQTASMKGESAKPNYAPETEQFRKWMAGYNDDQEKRIKGGIKKLHPAVEEDVKLTAAQRKKAEKQKGDDAAAFDAPKQTSGVPMTRAEFEAQQNAEPKSHFSKAH